MEEVRSKEVYPFSVFLIRVLCFTVKINKRTQMNLFEIEYWNNCFRCKNMTYRYFWNRNKMSIIFVVTFHTLLLTIICRDMNAFTDIKRSFWEPCLPCEIYCSKAAVNKEIKVSSHHLLLLLLLLLDWLYMTSAST